MAFAYDYLVVWEEIVEILVGEVMVGGLEDGVVLLGITVYMVVTSLGDVQLWMCYEGFIMRWEARITCTLVLGEPVTPEVVVVVLPFAKFTGVEDRLLLGCIVFLLGWSVLDVTTYFLRKGLEGVITDDAGCALMIICSFSLFGVVCSNLILLLSVIGLTNDTFP